MYELYHQHHKCNALYVVEVAFTWKLLCLLVEGLASPYVCHSIARFIIYFLVISKKPQCVGT